MLKKHVFRSAFGLSQSIHSIIIVFLLCTLLTSCNNKTVQVMKVNDGTNEYCKIYTLEENQEEYSNTGMKFEFDNGDFYYNKLDYIGESSNGFYTYTLELPGNQIEVSYVDTDTESKTDYFKSTDDIINIPTKTLYLSTDLANLIVSIPTVYEKERIYDSIQTVGYLEKPIQISHTDEKYFITYTFPKNNNYISEFFYLKSDIPLIKINSDTKNLLVKNELSGRFRLLLDGFYQTSYETYFPNGDGNYFRNCANYIATHYINYNRLAYDYDIVDFFDYISYSSTYIVNAQINESGFFETKSRSDWLYRDFLIDKNFYDTRFNADNAELNILLFGRFSDKFFEDTLIKYGDFFVQYANEHSYKTENGILVEDYYNPNGGLKTHVSLNHHLANLNVMLSLYNLTADEKYLDCAVLMLKGIEDTEQEWMLENHDLKYALYYTGTNNIMKDYPYLTYNDLYVTKKNLNVLGLESKTIDDLMASKMIYMINNNITGYFE